MTPLDYAFAMGETAEAASLLLRAGCSIWCCSKPHQGNSMLQKLLSHQDDSPISASVLCFVENVKQRRERLTRLAEGRLSQSVLEQLHRLGTPTDETRTRASWSALTDTGFKIPSYLDTRGISIFHQTMHEDLAEHLFRMGFQDLNGYDWCGNTPLMSIAREHFLFQRSNKHLSESVRMVDWLLSNGADPSKLHRDYDINALHVMARVEAIVAPDPQFREKNAFEVAGKAFVAWIDPIIAAWPNLRILNPTILLLASKVSPAICDSCQCGCSELGCTATTVLLKSIQETLENGYSYTSQILYEISAIMYNWYRVVSAVGSSVEKTNKEVRWFVMS